MSRRTLLVVLGALALVLALLPLVPRGQHDPGDLRPTADATPGAGVAATPLTPALRSEISRVVDAGRGLGRLSGGKASYVAAAQRSVRCADLAGQRYCLGVGWTDRPVSALRTDLARETRAAAGREQTGDLSVVDALAARARMAPTARAAADRAELEDAARSVGKIWLLRHQLDGETIPTSVTAGDPALRTAAARRTKTYADYPMRDRIIKADGLVAQNRYYWCGPTAMQMIAYGWSRHLVSQHHWARRLGTTTQGTGISTMVRTINRSTGWDDASHAGPYITLDIGSYSFRTWYKLMMRHVHDYRAPVLLHPVLLKRFYPYLDDDASGHFQVGRGYDKHGTGPDRLGYFEPWNQQKFDPSEPYIARVQWRNAYKSYRANRAHFQHNVGV